jgi:orotate phosphoribosyltransferase
MNWEQELKTVGALLEGHFTLTSGKHSDGFVLMSRLVAWPDRLRPWVQELAEFGARLSPTVVIGPAMGGVILAWALADALGPGVWAGFAEKTEAGAMEVRRGFPLRASDRVLLIEDAMTTGGSLLKARDAVEAHGAQVVGAVTLVDRRPSGVEFPLPFAAVTRLALSAYEPQDCPLCRGGQGPATRPKLS